MIRLDFTQLQQFQRKKFRYKNKFLQNEQEKNWLADEEIRWQFNQIWLGKKLFSQEWKHFRKLLRDFIHFFAFNYKDLHEVILEMHKMSLYKMWR